MTPYRNRRLVGYRVGWKKPFMTTYAYWYYRQERAAVLAAHLLERDGCKVLPVEKVRNIPAYAFITDDEASRTPEGRLP